MGVAYSIVFILGKVPDSVCGRWGWQHVTQQTCCHVPLDHKRVGYPTWSFIYLLNNDTCLASHTPYLQWGKMFSVVHVGLESPKIDQARVELHHTIPYSSPAIRDPPLKSVPCRFGSIAPGCCPSELLQSEHENYSSCVTNFHWNNFANSWKFVKLPYFLDFFPPSNRSCTTRSSAAKQN